MTLPEVVNIRTCKDFGTREGDVYIGRSTAKRHGSKWGNPYHLSNESQRQNVIAAYSWWVRDEINAGRLNLDEIRNAKRLGCYCKPLDCHGDVLITILEQERTCEGCCHYNRSEMDCFIGYTPHNGKCDELCGWE